jgi:hypothetical protein
MERTAMVDDLLQRANDRGQGASALLCGTMSRL